LTGHDEEGIIEIIAGNYCFVEKIHGNTTSKVKYCNKKSLATAPFNMV